MALRNIRTMGDETLNKVCREIKEDSEKLQILIDDMFDTMYESMGVGLAAPQVGILKRIVVIDVDYETPYVLINPQIIEMSGEQTGHEGCLSVPNKVGIVTRPDYVKVKALDREFNEFVLEGTEMLARAICHECDHLDGHLFTEKVEGELLDASDEYEVEE